jgi:hypothetical protein
LDPLLENDLDKEMIVNIFSNVNSEVERNTELMYKLKEAKDSYSIGKIFVEEVRF